jgi:hypothetical protein
VTIGEWLTTFGLSEYTSQFETNHIDVAGLSTLSDADLKEIGVGSLGHRRMILAQVQSEAAEAAEGTEMELSAGFWLHRHGGFFYVQDKGENPTLVALSRFIKAVAAHEQNVAAWIIHNHPPAGTKGEALTKFWKDLSAFMIAHADWLLLWKGQVYTNNMSLSHVGAALASHNSAVTELNWPNEARVELIDIFNTENRLIVRWDAVLAAAADAPTDPEVTGQQDRGEETSNSEC